eukprot:jgi/Botrbrau1/8837/Bobra.0335s0024.1
MSVGAYLHVLTKGTLLHRLGKGGHVVMASRSMAMSSDERKRLLAKSWTAVANGYERDLVPRFAPWTSLLLDALSAQELPPGLLLVPTCGPGQELPLLADAFPDRRVVGTDIAPGMVAAAEARLRSLPYGQRVQAAVGDACVVPTDLGPIAAIFSCFGLQQLPHPPEVLAQWVQGLEDGGIVAVVYWPSPQLQEDPLFTGITDPQALRALSRGDPLPQDTPAWDSDIPGKAVQAGGVLLKDELPRFPMPFRSLQSYFDIMVESGPLNSRLMHMGTEHIQELKAKFLDACPGPIDVPVELRPSARLLLLRKGPSSSL